MRREFLPLGVLAFLAGAFVLDLRMPLGFAGGIPYVIPVALSLFTSRPSSIFITAAVSTVLIVMGYHWSPAGVSPRDIVLMNRAFAVGAMWTVALLLFGARHFREVTRHLDAVREISWLIVMCSFCKQVRDRQGEWKPIEAYTRENLALRFSHGVCDHCLRQYYPDFLERP